VPSLLFSRLRRRAFAHERIVFFFFQEINPFTYVEINGLKIPEPTAAYNLLWEGVSGHDAAKDGHLRLSWKESLKALMRNFTTGNQGPGGHAW